MHSESQKTLYKKTVTLFAKHKKPFTIADISAATGGAIHDVQNIMPAICDEYGAHLQVTETGEILYGFPRGMKSRYTGIKPALKRFFSSVGTFLKKFGTIAFKIWIAATLIIYVVIFVFLIVAAIVIAIAASMSGNKNESSRRSNSHGSGELLINVLELANRILFYNAVTSQNSRSFEQRRIPPSKSTAEKRPLHVSVFSFVFGEPDPQRNINDTINKAVLAYLRKHNGCITLPEFIIITEFPPLKAEREILRFMKDYHGEPVVSENGTIIYSFPEITVTAEYMQFSSGDLTGVIRNPRQFSLNPKKSNITYSVLNAFNLIMGIYFFVNTAFFAETSNAFLFMVTNVLLDSFLSIEIIPLITGLGLGIIPIVFSIIFFLVPLIRSIRNRNENEKLKKENLRSVIYNKIWNQPSGFNPATFTPNGPLITPRQNDAVAAIAKEAGAYFGADISSTDSNAYIYHDIEQTKNDIDVYRINKKDTSQAGNVIFDSDR